MKGGKAEKFKTNPPSYPPLSDCAGFPPVSRGTLDENTEDKQKPSYMEKRELDQLSKDIVLLEKERDEINRIFNQPDVPYDDIKALSEAL